MSNRISEIEVTPIKPINGLVAFASFVFDDSFYLGSIGVYTRPSGGYRLAYPTRKTANGGLHVFHPINRKIATQIEEEIITKFKEVVRLSN
ncbi:MAG: septation protein SpoVG family protein [Candidatus Babeliaceae bacterium]|jgi:stage V sporulation protein G